MTKPKKIEEIEGVEIIKGYNSKILYAKINLSNLQYNQEAISILISRLQQVKDAGFTSMETSHTLGYYNEVEDISLTFRKENK